MHSSLLLSLLVLVLDLLDEVGKGVFAVADVACLTAEVEVEAAVEDLLLEGGGGALDDDEGPLPLNS